MTPNRYIKRLVTAVDPGIAGREEKGNLGFSAHKESLGRLSDPNMIERKLVQEKRLE